MCGLTSQATRRPIGVCPLPQKALARASETSESKKKKISEKNLVETRGFYKVFTHLKQSFHDALYT